MRTLVIVAVVITISNEAKSDKVTCYCTATVLSKANTNTSKCCDEVMGKKTIAARSFCKMENSTIADVFIKCCKKEKYDGQSCDNYIPVPV